MTPDQIEQAAKANNLNAPRVSPADLEDNIVHTEIVKHVTYSGKVLRWAVLTCRNGFAVTGNPSASVSIENDHAATGESVAISNAKSALWPLMGYALAEKLTTAKGEEAPASAPLSYGRFGAFSGCPNLPKFEDLAPHQQRVVVQYDQLYDQLNEKIAKLSAFLSQSPAPQLSSEDVYDLNQQLGAMGEYLIVLRRRIERF